MSAYEELIAFVAKESSYLAGPMVMVNRQAVLEFLSTFTTDRASISMLDDEPIADLIDLLYRVELTEFWQFDSCR